MPKRLKTFLMTYLLPPLIYVFLSVLKATLRIEHVNRGAVEKNWSEGRNHIICFWHGRLLMMPFSKPGGEGKVLVSRHRDGELISRIVHFFGWGTVRGSYRKRSVSSLREIIQDLKAGIDIGITPDGPKGPCRKVKDGIIELARLSRRPIVPVSYGASKKRAFHSWDGFVLPYPFSKIVFFWGDPMIIDSTVRHEDIEGKRIELEKTLNMLTESADKMACGG